MAATSEPEPAQANVRIRAKFHQRLGVTIVLMHRSLAQSCRGNAPSTTSSQDYVVSHAMPSGSGMMCTAAAKATTLILYSHHEGTAKWENNQSTTVTNLGTQLTGDFTSYRFESFFRELLHEFAFPASSEPCFDKPPAHVRLQKRNFLQPRTRRFKQCRRLEECNCEKRG